MAVLSLLVERRIGSNACPEVPTVSWEYRQMKNGLYNRDMANQAPSFLIEHLHMNRTQAGFGYRPQSTHL